MKLLRYIAGSVCILIFVSGMIQGIAALFLDRPLFEFMQSVSPPDAPPEYTGAMSRMTSSMMTMIHFQGIASILISILFLVVGLVILFKK